MTRVAVDAMGGDHAPVATVQGAASAAAANEALEIVLVGQEAAIRAALPDGVLPPRVRIEPAASVLEMHEPPIEALRRKPDSSIARALALLAAGEVDALVSAGNTGGVVAGATFALPRLAGARRAAIAAPFPAREGHCVLMDVGANIHAKASDLVEYAVMAREYTRAVLEIEEPRVGILSIGGEEGKGSPLVRKAAEALREFPSVHFTGNVEGQQIFSGDVDVVLCEGFVGNVILKASEGLLEAFVHHMLGRLRGELVRGSDHFGRTLGDVLEDLRNRTDYTRYGGAPLLGHEGVIVICHGRSPAPAIANAVDAAHRCIALDVNTKIANGLAELSNHAAVAAILGGN